LKTVVLLIKIKIYGAEKHVEGNICMNIEYYRQLTEDLPIGYAYHKIICNHAGNPVDYEYIEVNSAFEKFTGLNRTQILGRKVCELFSDLFSSKFNWIQEYGEIALNEGRKEFEQYSFLLNKWFRISVSSPEKYYFTTFFIDITDEVNELHKQKVLMNAMNDAVFVINDSLVVENVIAPDDSDILAPKDQIIGKSVRDLLPENVASLILSAIKNTRETKKKEVVEYPFIVYSEERWFKAEVKYIAINDTHKYVTNVSDITEQKQSEIKLKNKTLELDRFFSVNLDLLCIADTNGNLMKVNKSWESILGYTQDYLEGKQFFEFIHPDDLDATLKVMSKLENQEQVHCFVNRYRSLDGVYKYFEWRSHPYGNLIYAAARDITQRKQIEDGLYLEKEKLKITLFSIGDGVVSTDKQGKIVFINKIAEQLTGWADNKAIGKPFNKVFNIINEQTRLVEVNPVTKVLKTGKTVEISNHKALIRKDGSEIAIEDSAAPIRDQKGDIHGVVIVFRDVTDKKKILSENEYLSFHDYLTGLYNRRFFEEELSRLDTDRNLPLSVIMLDVNGLKLTNDAFGHEMGDALLKKVSDIIKSACRADDIIARIGGDEFAVILPKTDNIQAEIILKRIIERASKEALGSVIISIAVGYDTKTNASQDINDLLKSSDNLMYKNKIKTSRAMRNQTLQLVIDTLNKKYEKEQEHIERVCKICNHIGLALNMSEDDLKKLKLAGFLHDIGKIIIPADILNKSTQLTDDEFELIKRHSESGYQILKAIEEYSSIAEIVLCHHERWDGHGYPRKLKGTSIPLMSRIISVADAYEAMTADRPYRKAISKVEAAQELSRNSGKQFDPKIAQVFIEKVLNLKSICPES
jgi:diguanylate cyclase (GGDEF)-like protein/PAS domain S-box-containing protein